MQVAIKSLFAFCLLSSSVWAVEPPSPTPAVQPKSSVTATATNVTGTAAKPLTAEQIAKAKQQQEAKVKALVQDQANRLKQLENANLEALSQNQELQLKNDNLTVQV